MAKVFSSIKGKAKSAAKTVKRSTKKAYDVTKLKIDIKKEECNLDQCFEQLGRAVYANSKDESNSEKVQMLIEKADKIKEKIDQYKDRLALIQNKSVCCQCESIIDKNEGCQYCGEKIVANEKTNEDVEDFKVEEEENSQEEEEEKSLFIEENE